MIQEVIIKRKPGFQKGVVSNPNGRKPGTYPEHKRQFIEVQKIAAGKAPEMFNLLENAIKAGESWAHQIYWKELFSIPKRYLEDKAILPTLPDDKTNDLNARITTFVQAIDQFEDFTRDELMTTLKVLTNIKSNEIIGEQTEHIRLSREELGLKIENISAIMKLMEAEKNNETKEE